MSESKHHSQRERVSEDLADDLFQKVFRASSDAMTITDVESGRLVDANEALYSQSGYRSDEVIGKTTLELGMWPDAADRVRAMDMLRRDGCIRNLEIRLAHKSGELRDCLLSAELITSQGSPLMLAVTRDITAQKRAEEEKTSLREQLHQSQKMEAVGQLAGGVAHDFNNMLCSILGNAEFAQLDLCDDAQLRRSLSEIIKAAEWAADLTRQLLAFSRKQRIEPKVIDLGELVRGMRSMLTRLISENIVLRTLPHKELGRVQADRGQVEQVVLNLVINARDAMPKGGELLIETANLLLEDRDAHNHATLAPGAYVVLTVRDTGCGMSSDVREKIFEPFFTTKKLGQGTGLGLATVHGIVQQSGGSIEVSSEPGEGSAFTIYFPQVHDEIEIPGHSKVHVKARAQETVLVVEDEKVVRAMVTRVLESCGYTVLTANCGDQALAMAQKNEGPIDLLFTDLVMPGINGHELASRFSKLRSGIKVLYTSGYAPDEILGDEPENTVHFVGKPYSIDVLTAKIREVLDGK